MLKFLKSIFTIPTAEEIKKEAEAKVQPTTPIQPVINQPPAQTPPAPKPAPKKKPTAPKVKATPAKITGAKKAPAKPKKK
jgi:hypothetical protein